MEALADRGKFGSMVTAALCLLFAVAPEAAPTPSLVPTAAPSSATTFDGLPPAAPRVNDDKRVQQFVGALAGGVVGLAAGFAFLPLSDSLSGGICRGCLNPFNALVIGAAPLLSLVGAFAGYSVMGGAGSLLTTTLAMAPTVVVALGLLLVAREMAASTALDFAPFMVGMGAVLAGGAALALDVRGQQLSSLGAAAPWGGAAPGRVALTSLVSMLTMGASGALTVLAIAALAPVLSFVAVPFVALVGGALSVASTFAVYGVHRGMRGRGSLAAAFAGMGLALTASGAALALFAANSTNIAGAILMTELAVLGGVFFPMLALEFSHTQAVRASLPGVTFGAAPLRDGGMMSAALTF